MVGRFAIRHFCGSFLHAKMAAWLNGDTKGFFFFLEGLLDVLEVCDNEWDLLRKECGLEICGQTY